MMTGVTPSRSTLMCPSPVSLSSEIFEVDAIVNLPKMKTHAFTYITGAVKNTFGYVVGGNKMLIHSLATSPEKFAEAILDIYSIKPPVLKPFAESILVRSCSLECRITSLTGDTQWDGHGATWTTIWTGRNG